MMSRMKIRLQQKARPQGKSTTKRLNVERLRNETIREQLQADLEEFWQVCN